ncbi:MAG: inorganic pyrophosphatase Ppa [Proteobacteria bacterium]|nr:inorganic pyrophosphatase Ppa [Pseudomonadota bacterium]MBU1060168.1 inorganic pyrophosphatase Ppa [Pseudomonadota bacterium]
MVLRNFPEAVKEFAIQTYQKPKDEQDLRLTHVSFSGTPQKHPYNPDKVILVIDPYSSNVSYYEFLTRDISFVEELSNLVDSTGRIIPLMRLWVKKKSIGTRSTPFVVADTNQPL